MATPLYNIRMNNGALEIPFRDDDTGEVTWGPVPIATTAPAEPAPEPAPSP